MNTFKYNKVKQLVMTMHLENIMLLFRFIKIVTV